MTFDPTSVEVTYVTVPKDHCVQVPWEYVNVCGYSYQFCKNYHIHTYTYYVHTTYILHTTYRISDHIVSFWTTFRRDKNQLSFQQTFFMTNQLWHGWFQPWWYFEVQFHLLIFVWFLPKIWCYSPDNHSLYSGCPRLVLVILELDNLTLHAAYNAIYYTWTVLGSFHSLSTGIFTSVENPKYLDSICITKLYFRWPK